MSCPELNKHNVYPVPLPDHFGDVLLVYAPLTGDVFFSKRSFVERQELDLKQCGRASSDEFMRVIEESDNAEKPDLIDSPKRLRQLDIILNYKCNFSCSYCFSARGRNDKEISDSALLNTLSLVGRKDSGYDINKVVFTGGGEPLLSLSLLKDAVKTIRQWQKNADADISVVTNGSLLTDETLDYFRSNSIAVIISFEILRDLQETQRSHYDLCRYNILRAMEHKMVPGMRVTITPASVRRMREMIVELHKTFPKIQSLAMEAVVAPELFASRAELRDFYQTFTRQFSECRKQAASVGITPYCTSFMALDSLKIRMCPGKLCLTPELRITNCSRVSSDNEPLSEPYFYGSFSADKIVSDDLRFREHTKRYSLDSFPECQSCWARWNCGGGCARVRDIFPAAYFTEYCDFVRGCILQEVLDRYDAACRQNGETLKDYLNRLGNDQK